MLHITDITWARIAHPSEACTIGDEMEVMIIDFDLDKNRVSLGLKQKTKDPWVNIKKYKLRSTVTGKVASITVYGIFVELEKGVEGLVHNTELSWSKKIMSIADVTHKVGDRITAIIKEIDTEKRRISLSVKELAPNPWEIVAKTIKKDSIIEGEGVIQNVLCVTDNIVYSVFFIFNCSFELRLESILLMCNKPSIPSAVSINKPNSLI